ncbi:DUF3570 domain-containing protein [Granulosicoccus sp. 3-233]|uniref:DUF3570 domain-containing protein n=1 Tax=Granulosicoccus sp. 3-233 TaxID=3417969 RepID=UPI003D350942
MRSLRQQLSAASCALLSVGMAPVGTAASTDDVSRLTGSSASWELDTAYLSYRESDQRVSVNKAVATLARENETTSITVSALHDTMSGASPTGALRGDSPASTVTSVSGGNSRNRLDHSTSEFSDTRRQLGLGVEQALSPSYTLSYGGVVSDESDHESLGINLSLARESDDRLSTVTAGFGWIDDSIYRSDTGGTPEPLGNVQQPRPFSEGGRSTLDTLFGISRVLNRLTVVQLNLSLSASDGYHSDPYKVISAADEDGRIVANFHDSRPDSRLRTSVFGKLVHQLRDTQHSLHLGYRLYQDDWGIRSHTVDLRYRHRLNRQRYLEPHVRLYRQSAADFYQRKLSVDAGSNPLLPDNGLASADYRLDAMSSATLGLKYGVRLTPDTELRLRAEYLDQRFSTAVFDRNSALILQASFRIAF